MAFILKLYFFVYLVVQNFDPGASITVPFTSLSPKLPFKTGTTSTTLDKNAEPVKNCANPSTLKSVNNDFNSGTKSPIDFNLGSKSPPSSTAKSITTSCAVGNFQDGKIVTPVTQLLTPAKQSVTVSPQKSYLQSSFVSNPQGSSSQINSLSYNNSYLLPTSSNVGSSSPTLSSTIFPSTGAGESQTATNIFQLSSPSSPQVELSQKICQNPQILQQSLDTNNYLSRFQQNLAQNQVTSQSPITSSFSSQNSLSTSNLCENVPSFSVTSTATNLSEVQKEQIPDVNVKSFLYMPNSVQEISKNLQPTQCNIKDNTSFFLNQLNNVKGPQDNVNTNYICKNQNEANKITVIQNQQPNLVNTVSNTGNMVFNTLNSNTAFCKPQEANLQENSQRIQSILQNINSNINKISSTDNIPAISSSIPYTSETNELNKNTQTFNSYAFAPNAQNVNVQPKLIRPNTISRDANSIQSSCFKGFYSLSPSTNLSIQSSDNQLPYSNLQFASQIYSDYSNNNFNNASPFNIVSFNDSHVLKTESNALHIGENKQIVGQPSPSCIAPGSTQSVLGYGNCNNNIEPKQSILAKNQQTHFNIINSAQNFNTNPIYSKPCETPSFQLTDNIPNLANVISIPQSSLDKNNQQIVLNTHTSPNCPTNIQIVDLKTLSTFSNTQDSSQAQFVVKNIGQSQNIPNLTPLLSDCNNSNQDLTIIPTPGAINDKNINYNLNEFNSPSLGLSSTRIPYLENNNLQSNSQSQSILSPNLSNVNFYKPTTLNPTSQPDLRSTSECFAPVNSFDNNPRVLKISPNFTFFSNLDNSQSYTPQSSNYISCVGPQNGYKETFPSRPVTLTVSPNFSYFSNIAPTISNSALNLDSSSDILSISQDQTLNNVEIPINKDNQVFQPTITQISGSVMSNGSPKYQIIQPSAVISDVSPKYQVIPPTITEISTPSVEDAKYQGVQPISSPVINNSPKYQSAILDGMSSLLDHYRSANQAIQTCNTPSEIPVEIITEPKCSTQPIQIPHQNLASINQNDVTITPSNEIACFNQFSNIPLDFSSLFPYYTSGSITAPVIEVATTNPSTFYSSSQFCPSSSLDSINQLISSPDANSANLLPVLQPPPPLLIDSSRKNRPYDSVLKLLLLTELLDNDGCNDLNSLLALLAAYNI